jgi:hypothetical protein
MLSGRRFAPKAEHIHPAGRGNTPGIYGMQMKTLALKARFTGGVIRSIVAAALIPRAVCLPLRPSLD